MENEPLDCSISMESRFTEKTFIKAQIWSYGAMESSNNVEPHSNGDAHSALSTKNKWSSVQGSPKEKCMKTLKSNWLTIATFSAVLLGFLVGYAVRQSSVERFDSRTVMYINFPGELFLRMLKGLILPLIISSLISAVGTMDTSLSGKIGSRAVVYYMVTTILAIILGIILVVSIQPGAGDSKYSVDSKNDSPVLLTADTLLDLVRNMFPTNIVEACFATHKTVLTEPPQPGNTSLPDYNFTTFKPEQWNISGSTTSGTNILGLVVFSLVLGIVLGKMGPQGKPLLDLFTSLGDAMMNITKIVISFSPIGVFFLITSKIVEIEDPSLLINQLGKYTGTVLLGIMLHGFLVLPIIYSVFVRKLPFRFISGMLQALTTAFATSSSSATLPVTFQCLEDNNGIDRRVSRFCLPIGATINMDGTALYEAVAAIFISQVRGMEMDVGKILVISITATAASIGAAGIPQAGLVTMVMVLNAVGLPAEDVGIIFAVDWFLDRFRTVINVLGDAFGAGIVAHLSRADLEIRRDSENDIEVEEYNKGFEADHNSYKGDPA